MLSLAPKLIEMIEEHGQGIFLNKSKVLSVLEGYLDANGSGLVILDKCLSNFLFYKCVSRKTSDGILFLRSNIIYQCEYARLNPNDTIIIVDSWIRAVEYVKNEKILSKLKKDDEGMFNILFNAVKNYEDKKYNLALSSMLRLAERGIFGAYYYMGKFYLEGLAIGQDNNKALDFFNQSLQMGNPDGMYAIAQCYEDGIGQAVDKTKAFEMLIKASQHGSDDALYKLAESYYKGINVDVDIEKAFEFYKLSANQGNMDATMALAKHFFKEGIKTGDYKGAYEWFHFAASNGNVEALFRLGEMYKEGCGIPPDLEKSKFYIARAASKGYVQAIETLGGISIRTEQVVQNEDMSKASREDIMKAARTGNVRAQFSLGIQYFEGKGGERSLMLAYNWFTQAQRQGLKEAGPMCAKVLYELGMQYYTGSNGEKKDYVKAVSFFSEIDNHKQWALSETYCNSTLILGVCYFTGQGVTKDEKMALHYFNESIQAGSKDAYLYLAKLYHKGSKEINSIPKALINYLEYSEATGTDLKSVLATTLNELCSQNTEAQKLLQLKTLEKLCALEIAQAHYLTGVIYEKGEGINADLNEAKVHYEKAAKIGHAGASEKLLMLK